tara:strand:+ start:1027 stop:1515 length:489 start_codon:yes stop_codon:yes gene_type:complete
MKTFFIALILGIFIGATITTFYNSPESVDNLISSISGNSSSSTQSRDEIVEKAKESAGKIAEKIKEGTQNLLENTREERAELVETGREIVDSATDATIKAKIAAKLKEDSSVDAERIEILVENRSVILSGEVSSSEETKKARDIALDIQSVIDVKSNLKIAP